MTTREAWLDEGLTVLAELGATALRIDRIAARLRLSKGSFYHHFAGMSGYRLDLLDHYERRFTARYIDLVAQRPDSSAEDKMAHLVSLVLSEREADESLDVAMRAWAAQDDDVRATLERIDGTRLAYLVELYEEMVGAGPEAVFHSQRLYLLLIGARHVLPPLTRQELRDLYDWVLADKVSPSTVPRRGRR